MIGNFLHVITTSWMTETGLWQPRTFVSTIDIADGNRILDQRTLPLSASQVGATGKYLWISAENGHYSTNQNLIVFPISANGLLGKEKQTSVGGRIQDKFKVGDTSDGLAVIVQSWQEWEQVTAVETYREEESSLSRIGGVELIRGESLYASRFDVNRCYVVTFRQTDPLWIVDLSDPTTPLIRGQQRALSRRFIASHEIHFLAQCSHFVACNHRVRRVGRVNHLQSLQTVKKVNVFAADFPNIRFFSNTGNNAGIRFWRGYQKAIPPIRQRVRNDVFFGTEP